MDLKVILCFYLIALISTTKANPRNANENNRRKRPDPVQNFLSELGDLFLDIDQTVADQTAPKVSYEDRIATQIFRPLRHPPSEVFNRIRQNYRALQKRLGSLIDQTLTPSERVTGDLYRTETEIRNLLQNSFAPLKPLRNEILKIASEEQNQFPVGAGDNLKNSVNEVNVVDQRTTPDKSRDPLTNLLPTVQGSERSLFNKHQTTNTDEQLRKIVQKMISDARRTNEYLNSMSSKTLDDVSSILVRRMGEISEDSRPQERIIEDVLNSESRFDKFVRQLLQTHGRWVLDNPLLNIWRDAAKISRGKVTVETNSEITSPKPSIALTEDGKVTLEESTSTEPYVHSSKTEVTEPIETFHNLPESHPLSASYYRIDDGGRTEEEIDIVVSSDLEDEGIKYMETEEEEIEVAQNEVEEKSEGTVILAFTSDGIPLKLRMGSEIENPIKYLHRILRAAGVSLKIPVASYKNTEPVGKEVLLLGAGADITRTVNIDVSNRNELKSLLKTLMKSKVPGSR